MATIELFVNGLSVYSDNVNDFGPAISHIEGYFDSVRQQMEEHNMALTQAQEERFDRITGMLTEFGGEVHAVLAAAQSVQGTLQGTIARLEDQILQLSADDAADANMIASLQQTLSEIKAASAANEEAVVGALDSFGSQVTALDETVGGDAEVTTTTPEPVVDETTTTPEPVVEEPVEEPTEFTVDDSGLIVPVEEAGAAG
jgi:hypothetical protein